MQHWHDLVLNKVKLVLAFFARLISPLFKLIAAVFGSWQAPRWLLALQQLISSILLPVSTWSGKHAAWVLLVGVLSISSIAGPAIKNADYGHYWQKIKGLQMQAKAKLASFKSVQPNSPQISNANITVTRPVPMQLDVENAKPNPVVFAFNLSAAPLTLVGKVFDDKAPIDVSISPAIKGRWLWLDAKMLSFTPTEEWPIDVEYNVLIGDKALAPHVLIDSTVTFKSPSFEMNIATSAFYQDPVQTNLRKAIFDVTFSHPVAPESFEKRLDLSGAANKALWVNPNSDQKLSVTYDKWRLHATVHSEPLIIPENNEALTLKIDSGVAAQHGGNVTPAMLNLALEIPGLSSLDITELKDLVITNDNGEPESVLQIVSDMEVHEKEMARSVQAWLLPDIKAKKSEQADQSDEPSQAEDATLSPWTDPAAITAAVLKTAKKIVLTTLPAERESGSNHAFKYAAEPGRYMLVRINKGLKSMGGYQLGATRDEVVLIKQFAPELTIMSKGSLLALSGEKKLPLIVRDLPGVRYEIGRLLPQQLQHLVTQSQGEMTRPEFYNNITPDNLTERFEKKIPLSLKAGKTHYESVDFSDYLNNDNNDRRGVFLLTVQGYDPKSTAEAADPHANQNRYEGDYYEGDGSDGNDQPQAKIDPTNFKDSRLVIVTDLGLIAKQATDGARDVFVQSISEGKPVEGAMVEVWARNGAVLVARKTDINGVANVPSLTGFTREKTPALIVVKKAGDLSYLPLDRSERNLDLSRFDVGGLSFGNLPNQIQAYLFSDRGMYRPGDTIHIGIVAKQSSWAQKLSDVPVEVEVIDARGLVVRREVIKIGAGGMAEFTHSTLDSSPTGNYTINLNMARETGTSNPNVAEVAPLNLGSVVVKVQEFMPDRMKVVAKLSTQTDDGWVRPQDLKAIINVQNLFGAPAQKRRVTGALTLSPTFPSFKSYPDYTFVDPQRAKEKFEENLADAETDDTGNVDVALGLQRFNQATYQMHVLVKAFEPEGGRSVSAEISSLISDRPYLIGYKAVDDLNYVSRGTKRMVNLLAIDPKAMPIDAKNLKLLRVENKVISVLMKQANGLYKYESRAKESVLEEKPYAIAKTGNALILNTQTPGNFAYAIRDSDGLELTRVNYSVAGVGNVSRSLDRNAELQLTLNKKDYNPGEAIELNIRAPYAGAGLITIERDKVYAYQWFNATTTASTQTITLPKDFEGSGYVSVQFARDIASDEIYMSPMSYGVVPFATSLARRTNVVSLKAPDLVKPGDVVNIELTSKTPTRAVVFAVDEGILQVARYQAPDVLKFFFQKRALEVNTQQTLDLILPEFKKLMQAAAPGGDAAGEAGKNLNPFKRKRDKPVAFWSGIVDVAGSKTVSYTVPEYFNGSLKVFAITVNDDTAAAVIAKTTVRGDLILLPNVPVAITPGDAVEIGIGVANQLKGSGKNAPVLLSLSVGKGLEVVGKPQQTLNIDEKAEGATKFMLRAKAGEQAQLGSSSVIFTALLKGKTVKLSTDVSVRPASPFVTLVQTGVFKGTGELKAQANLYPNFARSEAAVSASPWAFTSGLIQYLDVYPHGCTEQITSQVFPAVLLSSQPGLAQELLKQAKQKGANNNGFNNNVPDINKTFSRYLSMVRARQSADGGFSMWPGGQSEMFPTTYVVSLLLEARDRKLAVPNDMLQRANVYLQADLARAVKNDYEWRYQTHAAYLLTRQGIVTTAILSNLNEAYRKQLLNADTKQKLVISRDLGTVYLAASYQMLRQEKIANDLLQPAFKQLLDGDEYWKHWYWNYYYDPLIHNAALVQMVAKHFPKRIKEIPLRYWEQLATVVSERYYQSHSASQVMLAVDAYQAAAAASAAGKVKLSALDSKGVLTSLPLPEKLLLAKTTVPFNTSNLKIANLGELPLFYSWAESGYERKLPATAISNGMEIEHEFLDANGKAITEAVLGDELTVRVRVRATERDYLNQVALVDILPAGLEPVLSSAEDAEDQNIPLWRKRLGGSSSWAIDYADIREDRVIFYGNVSNTLTEVTYKVRATNVGEFVVPAAYGEAMYEQKIFARAAGARFKVHAVVK